MKVKNRLDYKYVIVTLCFLMVFTCLSFCSGTKSLYLAAVTEALNLKRSLFSLNDSCRFITTSIVNLFFGALIEKFGARKLIGAGFASLIISMMINAHAESIYQFYIGGCFLGMGLSWTTTTMIGYVVSKWCKEKRGTIMGFVLAANGLGGALVTQIVSPIIYNESDPFGYRNAYKLTALILLVVGTLVVLLFRNDPEGKKSNEKYVKEKKPKNPSWSGLSFEEAIRTPYFYGIAFCVFLTGTILQGISGTSTAHLKDTGLDPAYVATVVSVHSLALAGFKFLVGVLHDRIGLKRTMLICYAAAVISLTLLGCVTNSGAGKVFAMIYGVLSSLAMPLETIMLPLITADLFGEKAYSKLLGVVVSVNTAGYALGAPIFNLVFDIVGTYQPILFVFAAVMVVIAFVFVRTLAEVEKKREGVAKCKLL